MAAIIRTGISLKEIWVEILIKATTGIGACIHKNHPRENFLNFFRATPKGTLIA